MPFDTRTFEINKQTIIKLILVKYWTRYILLNVGYTKMYSTNLERLVLCPF